MSNRDSDPSTLTELAARVRASNALGKSIPLARLFDYLVTTSLEDRSPKEAEVAAAVFGREQDFDAMQDASVRVYVHRLRRKLDEHYEDSPAGTRRLIVPKGEYRLAITATDEKAASSHGWHGPIPWTWVAATFVATLTATAILWLVLLRPIGAARDLAAVRGTPIWRALASNDKPIVIALGDYYIFGEAGKDGRVQRLVREFKVNSRYDLDELVMQRSELNGRYVDLGLRYYPVGIGRALRDIVPIFDGLGQPGTPPRVLPVSDMSPAMLRSQNIVYLGYLSGLGVLRNPVFSGSRLEVGSSYDELIDRVTGRVYAASTGQSGDNAPRQDYAYISRFAGPEGTSIVIIAGTRDAALMQAASYASHLANLDELEARAGGAASFEALLRVDTLGDQNLSGKLIFVSPLKTDAIWNGRTALRFP